MVSSSPSDIIHCQCNSCQGHRVSLSTKQKQSSSRWEEVKVSSHTQRNTANDYLLYSYIRKTFLCQRRNNRQNKNHMPIRPWCLLVLQGMQVQGEKACISIKGRVKLIAQFLILFMLLSLDDPNIGNCSLVSRNNSVRACLIYLLILKLILEDETVSTNTEEECDCK